MFSVHLCVHYILYAKTNKQLVLGYVVAQLDACREWSYQVEHKLPGIVGLTILVFRTWSLEDISGRPW